MFRSTDVVFALPLAVLLPPLFGTASEIEVPLEEAIPLADGFDFPVGRPNAEGYYDAQPFGDNNHLGQDWNGNGGGNTDHGDPVFSIAAGVVTFAEDVGGGWGRIVRVAHRYEQAVQVAEVESFYAHLDQIDVRVGDTVRRGSLLGTIGDADGHYISHLHFELRDQIGLGHGPGYAPADEAVGWINPQVFIAGHRPNE